MISYIDQETNVCYEIEFDLGLDDGKVIPGESILLVSVYSAEVNEENYLGSVAVSGFPYHRLDNGARFAGSVNTNYVTTEKFTANIDLISIDSVASVWLKINDKVVFTNKEFPITNIYV